MDINGKPKTSVKQKLLENIKQKTKGLNYVIKLPMESEPLRPTTKKSHRKSSSKQFSPVLSHRTKSLNLSIETVKQEISYSFQCITPADLEILKQSKRSPCMERLALALLCILKAIKFDMDWRPLSWNTFKILLSNSEKIHNTLRFLPFEIRKRDYDLALVNKAQKYMARCSCEDFKQSEEATCLYKMLEHTLQLTEHKENVDLGNS